MAILQRYIEINGILGGYSVQFSINENSFALNGHFVLGSIMIVLASLVRFRAKDNIEKWVIANSLVERSFEASDSPIKTTRAGCLGLLFGSVENTASLSLFLMGLDQIFLNGVLSIAIANLGAPA